MPLLDLTPRVAVPGSLATYTRAGLIVPELRERDTAGVISELSVLLQRSGSVPDLLPFYHSALNQELLTSSALQNGIALPHARSSGVKQLQFAFGRTREPIMWGAKSAWPVQLIFLLAVPATDAASYLHVLASIAKLGQQHDCLAELRAAQSPEQILAVLQRIRIRQG
ncbi:MAG TPA: PTS sugar transporter subunit IIA [Verrucomicrobiae bacterium]